MQRVTCSLQRVAARPKARLRTRRNPIIDRRWLLLAGVLMPLAVALAGPADPPASQPFAAGRTSSRSSTTKAATRPTQDTMPADTQESRPTKVGDHWTNPIGIVLTYIPAGEFTMGSGASEGERGDERQHQVRITRAFLMGRTEVTRGQFAAFVKEAKYTTDAEGAGERGWGWDGQAVRQDRKYNWKNTGFNQVDDHPVVNISWNDAAAFCAWLSKREGRKYRLPTEAEWEYACRAGTATPFNTGATIRTEDANYDGRYVYGNGVPGMFRGRTTHAATFAPNAWGLYDMHGNAWEWCSDWYGSYPPPEPGTPGAAGPAIDPTGPATGTHHVLRGGSWYSFPANCRSAARFIDTADHRAISVGFRVVVELD